MEEIKSVLDNFIDSIDSFEEDCDWYWGIPYKIMCNGELVGVKFFISEELGLGVLWIEIDFVEGCIYVLNGQRGKVLCSIGNYDSRVSKMIEYVESLLID